MQRTWRGKDKPRKKNRYHGNKGRKWNSEGEDAFYEKLERQKRHQRQEELDELEQFDELQQADEFGESDDLEDSDEIEDLEEAELNR